MVILGTKKEIRSVMRRRFGELSDNLRDERSDEACRRLFETFLRDAEPMRVGLFMSMPNEVQTAGLIRRLVEQGRHRLLIPRCEDRETICFYPLEGDSDLSRMHYGILEPTCPREAEEVPKLLVVPGVAFGHTDGSRLGHGAGYYDRYLELHESEIDYKVGLSLGLQLLETVPTDPHDRPLDALVWEEGVTLFNPARVGR